MHFRIYKPALIVLTTHHILCCMNQQPPFHYLSGKIPTKQNANGQPYQPSSAPATLQLSVVDLKKLAQLPLLPPPPAIPIQAQKPPQNQTLHSMQTASNQNAAALMPPPPPRKPKPGFAVSKMLHNAAQEQKAFFESQQALFKACESEAMRIQFHLVHMQVFFNESPHQANQSGYLPASAEHLSSSMRIHFASDAAIHAANSLYDFHRNLAANAHAQKQQKQMPQHRFQTMAYMIPPKLRAFQALLTAASCDGDTASNQQFQAQYTARAIPPKSTADHSGQRLIYLSEAQIAFAKKHQKPIYYL